MIDKIAKEFEPAQRMLNLRAYRSAVLATNIANSATPYYKAVDFDFRAAMLGAIGSQPGPNTQALATTDSRHFGPATVLPLTRTDSRDFSRVGTDGTGLSTALQYRHALQPRLDGNSVDVDTERMAFTENALKYQSTLTFLNKRLAMLSAAVKGV